MRSSATIISPLSILPQHAYPALLGVGVLSETGTLQSTAPVLSLDTGTLMDSFDIAQWADAHSQRSPWCQDLPPWAAGSRQEVRLACDQPSKPCQYLFVLSSARNGMPAARAQSELLTMPPARLFIWTFHHRELCHDTPILSKANKCKAFQPCIPHAAAAGFPLLHRWDTAGNDILDHWRALLFTKLPKDKVSATVWDLRFHYNSETLPYRHSA